MQFWNALGDKTIGLSRQGEHYKLTQWLESFFLKSQFGLPENKSKKKKLICNFISSILAQKELSKWHELFPKKITCQNQSSFKIANAAKSSISNKWPQTIIQLTSCTSSKPFLLNFLTSPKIKQQKKLKLHNSKWANKKPLILQTIPTNIYTEKPLESDNITQINH